MAEGPPPTNRPARKPSLMINAMSNWAALGANMLVGFIITPYIIFRLGTDSFGVYDLVVVIIGYSGLLDLGVTSALMRYAARYAGQDDAKSLNQVLNTAFAGFATLGLAVFLAALAFSGPIAGLFKVEAPNREVFRTVLVLFGASAGLTFPGTVLSVFVLAHERYVLSNTVKTIAAVVRGSLSYLVLYLGGGLVSLSMVFVLTSFLILLMNLGLVVRFIPRARFAAQEISLATARDLFTFGFFTFINKSGDILRFRMGQAIIKFFMTFEYVGLYGLGAMLFRNVMKVTIACSGVTHPRLSALAGQDDPSEFRHSFLRYSMVVSSFAAVVGTVAFLIAPEFLRVWLPQRVTDEEVRLVTLVTFILLGGFLPDVMTNVTNNGLQAIRRHHFLAYQTLGEGVVGLALAVILVQRYGVPGVAAAAAIPALVTKLAIQPIYATREIGVAWAGYYARVILRPVAVMGCAGSAIFALERYVHGALAVDSLGGVAVKALVLFAILGMVAFVFCLDGAFRRNAWRRLQAIPGALGGRTRCSAE